MRGKGDIRRWGLVWGLVSALLSGAVPAASEFETRDPENGQFVVEYLYNFTKRDYVPPAAIKAVTRKEARYGTPEEAFVAQMSAMLAPDYEWWLAGWTAESRKQIQARNEKLQRSGKDWEGLWKKGMRGKEIRLEQRVESGQYVMIAYAMYDATGKKTFNSIFACEKVGEQWMATQALAEDQMFHHYLTGQRRVRLNVR